MSDDARKVVRSLATDQQLTLFGARLRAWVMSELAAESGQANEFTESRARALLRSAGALDDATLNDFNRLAAGSDGVRLALHDLLAESGLAEQEEVRALAAVTGRGQSDEAAQIEWLSLILSSQAWKRGYPLGHLDPSSPPQRFSPAGQVVANTAAFLRHQVQRSATERERLARLLAPRDPDSAATLNALHADGTIPPLPPHFRPPIPVRYPEISRETLHVEPDEASGEAPPVRGESLVITDGDLPGEAREAQRAAEQPPAVRMPALRITREQVQPPQPPSPLPPSAVVMPANTAESRPGLTVSLRQMFGSEALATTKLRIVAQGHPDGPGLYGLQVKVRCKGIKSFVAGTTDRDGRFVAELPVKRQEGLTYDVDLTWPREMGGEVERKSITLHADRTEFTLPFYRKLEARGGTDEASA